MTMSVGSASPAGTRPMIPAAITGAASAVPPSLGQEELWAGFFGSHFADSRWAHRVFTGSGVRRRHSAVDPTVEDVSGWSTGARMARYLVEAMPLGKAAVSGALAEAGLAPADVGLLAVVSCTGYATPGVDIRLARDLGMAGSTQRLFIGHMGCYAALPALGAVSDYVVARGRPAVLCCVELASLHLQPATDDLEQVVAHALFSDAASALVVEPAAPGGVPLGRAGRPLTVVDVAARTDAATADYMTWEVTDLGFRMGLSRRVPDVLARHVDPLVASLLADNGVSRDQVAAWAVHPGGPSILDVVTEQLGLGDDALAESRHVLAEDGNCSSATVLLVLDEIRRRRDPPPGSFVVALAFGPGLTLYAALLRVAEG
jgi:alkylresorcinol/alkylpyrone synthase